MFEFCYIAGNIDGSPRFQQADDPDKRDQTA
jgi:hypothetical protein